MAYDAECLEADILNIVQSNLPAKLAAIDAEKNDGLVTTPIPNSDYYSSIVNQVINADPYINYMIQSIDADTQSVIGNTAREYVVLFQVVFIDTYSSADVRKKAFRYIRALREVIDENFRKIKACSGLDISEFLPTDMVSNDNNSVYYKIGGVKITTTIL